VVDDRQGRGWQLTGCTAGTLTDIFITTTQDVAPGLRSAIIQAVGAAGPPDRLPRPPG
jgi:hypothetical protein